VIREDDDYLAVSLVSDTDNFVMGYLFNSQSMNIFENGSDI